MVVWLGGETGSERNDEKSLFFTLFLTGHLHVLSYMYLLVSTVHHHQHQHHNCAALHCTRTQYDTILYGTVDRSPHSSNNLSFNPPPPNQPPPGENPHPPPVTPYHPLLSSPYVHPPELSTEHRRLTFSRPCACSAGSASIRITPSSPRH